MAKSSDYSDDIQYFLKNFAALIVRGALKVPPEFMSARRLKRLKRGKF